MSRRDATKCHWSLDNFLCVSQAPDGRTENSLGLQPWDDTHKEIALKGRPNVIDYNV